MRVVNVAFVRRIANAPCITPRISRHHVVLNFSDANRRSNNRRSALRGIEARANDVTDSDGRDHRLVIRSSDEKYPGDSIKLNCRFMLVRNCGTTPHDLKRSEFVASHKTFVLGISQLSDQTRNQNSTSKRCRDPEPPSSRTLQSARYTVGSRRPCSRIFCSAAL